MNERVIAQYCKKVGKKLVCGRAQKKRLLGGLAQELTERFGGSPVTKDELLAQVGAPADTAELLQESVTPEERVAFERKRRRVWITVVVSFLAILMFIEVGYICFWENHIPTYYKETIFIDSPYGTVQETIDPHTIWETKSSFNP